MSPYDDNWIGEPADLIKGIMSKLAEKLNIIVIKESNQWVGQVLEFDLASQAPTLALLGQEMFRIILVAKMVIDEKKGLNPFEAAKPAPKEYWDRWTTSTTKVDWPTPDFDYTGITPIPAIEAPNCAGGLERHRRDIFGHGQWFGCSVFGAYLTKTICGKQVPAIFDLAFMCHKIGTHQPAH